MGFKGQEFAFSSPAAAVADLVGKVRDAGSSQQPDSVELAEAAGRILAQDVQADRDSPPFDYSAMDGFAVCAAQLLAAQSARGPTDSSHAPLEVSVVAEARIGHPPPVDAFSTRGAVAVRIATGAPIPLGADAILKREDVRESTASGGGQPDSISVPTETLAHLRPGANIRRRGENAGAGAVVLPRGQVLSAAALGTLAAVGAVRPLVCKRLRVAIITTGDEVVEPHESPTAFQIRNSNAPSLQTALRAQPWIHIVSAVHVGDNSELPAAVSDASRQAQAVVVTGGISMGHRDLVRSAIEQTGAQIMFHGLPQRPGKPMLAAVLASGSGGDGSLTPIFGLPGNPVAALVTAVRVVLPVLAARAGAERTPSSFLSRLVELGNPDKQSLKFWWYRPARLVSTADGSVRAELIDSRGSGDMISAGISDGFLEIAPGANQTTLPFYSWPVGA